MTSKPIIKNDPSRVGGIDLGRRKILLERLGESLARFLSIYQSLENPDALISESWTAKDVLGHITFWHESFARNVVDLACGNRPHLLKGRLSDLNQQGVDEMKHHSTDEILLRVMAAQAAIHDHILTPSLGSLRYRRGSRCYTPEEYLEMVEAHIRGHGRELQSQSSKLSGERK